MRITVRRFDTSSAAVIEYTCPGCGPFSATFAAGDDTFVHDCDQADEECLPMAGGRHD